MTETSLQLPRACSYCSRPASTHACVPPEGFSRFLCYEHTVRTDSAVDRAYSPTAVGGALTRTTLADCVVDYPDPLTIPVVAAVDDDMASWEPCRGVSYPDGYYSGPYPCEDLAEPGEALCVRCRRQQ